MTDGTQPDCTVCESIGWVCEDHPEVAFGRCACGAAGMPCPICNRSSATHVPRHDGVLEKVVRAGEKRFRIVK